MSAFLLPIRTLEAPHEVLAGVRVDPAILETPYGHTKHVSFVAYRDTGKLTDPFQYSRIDLPLHRLVVNGVLVLALMVKRDEWPKIRADIGSSLVLGAAPPPKKPAFDLDALCDAARARIAAQIDESATKHMRAIRLQNRAVEGLALMTFKRISLEFRAETGQL